MLAAVPGAPGSSQCGAQSDLALQAGALNLLIKFSPDKTDSNWLGIKCLATNERRSYLIQPALSSTELCFTIQTNLVERDKKLDKAIKIMSESHSYSSPNGGVSLKDELRLLPFSPQFGPALP